MEKTTRVLLLTCLIYGCTSSTPAPVLRIETGMHTAMIQHASIDAEARILATCSRDKTIRLWDVDTGTLLSTLHPPIGAEDREGMIFAVALSPDSSLVAAGGITGATFKRDRSYSVYLFDRITGRMVRRMGDLPGIIYHLKFSPDGTRLAVLLKTGGLHVFRTEDGKTELIDSDYGNDCTGLDFDRTGRIVTSCTDGLVRLYDISLTLIAKEPGFGGSESYSVNFSPDGANVAVGYGEKAHVSILSGADLHPLFLPDTTGLQLNGLASVTWSLDGKELCAGGGDSSHIRCWHEKGVGTYRNIFSFRNEITDLLALPNDRLLFVTTAPSWGILSAQGQPVHVETSFTADFHQNPNGLLVDSTGATVYFRYGNQEDTSAIFSLEKKTLTFNPPTDELLPVHPPRLTDPLLPIVGWPGTTTLYVNGKKLALGKYVGSALHLSIAPTRDWLIIGTSRNLFYYERTGAERWRIAIPSETQAVNISGDGRLIVAAFNDGTIRWYSAKNGSERLAFFPHTDGKRWVAWTPRNYYDASTAGEEMIGWHVNHGLDQSPDFFPAKTFSKRFHRPNIISHALSDDSP